MDAKVAFAAPEIGVFRHRWYLLSLYGFATLWQAAIYNSIGPISSSLKIAYPGVWTDGQTSMQGNWGSIMYALFFLPTPILMRKYGLQFVIAGGVVLTWIGSGLRCLSTAPEPFLVLCHLCSILNGVCMPLQMVVVPAFSARWFPNHERTTATSVICAMNNLGVAVAFLLPSLLVPHDTEDATARRWYIQQFMWIEFVVSTVLLLPFLVYFPEQPPKPPSLTARRLRLGPADSFLGFLRNPLAWGLMVVFALSIGPGGVFTVVINVDLESLGQPAWAVNLFGAFSVIGTSTLMVILSFWSDRVILWLKAINLALLSAACILYAWFVGLAVGFISEDDVSLYASVGFGQALNYCAYPLLIELTAEALYPVEESVSSALLQGAQSLVQVAYISVAIIPSLNSALWFNYALLVSVALSIPLLAVCGVEYKRTTEDEKIASSLKSDGVRTYGAISA